MDAKRFFFLVASIAAVRSANAQYFEARNTAMGGTGTASSRYLAAGFANPALLTHCGPSDDYGFLLPTVGAAVVDQTDLIKDVKDFADQYDQLIAGGSPQDIQSLAANLQNLADRQLVGNMGAGLAFAMPAKGFAWSLHLNSYVNLRSVVQIDPADITALNNYTSGPLPVLNSKAIVVGAGVTDLGLSIAHEFDLGFGGLSIGATPKYQRVDTYNYVVAVDAFAASDFRDSQYRNADGNFNLDLGASLYLPSGVTLGAMARDLIANDYSTVTTDEQFVYQIAPIVTIGAAWEVGMLTISSDVDLTKQGRFTDQSASLQALHIVDDVQWLRAGAELDIALMLQLRGGIQYDLQNELPNSYSGGLGLAPFDVFHVDIAFIYSGENSYGAVAQFAFTF
ncbi:MAG: conjugal transfer protein TraF [Planctomycetota bacterium]|nr:conjugal transfer protein TraF [Planctomycetota bacterium]